ncbi:hypothetical protein BGZ76_009689, partial [Entomortierella beljakovae]
TLSRIATDDSWGWDDDDIDIGSEAQVDEKQDDISKLHDLKYDEVNSTKESELRTGESELDVTESIKAAPLLPSHASPTITSIPERFTHLSIQEGHVSSGANSGDCEEDASTQSPWQDISPASASKRSEAGLMSEVESEFSGRSLDEFERVSPILDHVRNRSSGSGSGSITSGSNKGVASTMSWTDLKHDEWDMNSPEIAEFSISDKTKQTTQGATAAAEIDEMSGADSWDFGIENEIGLQSKILKSPFAGQSTGELPRELKTPEPGERHSSGVHIKSSSDMSSSHPLPYQSSLSGSIPPSPNQHFSGQLTSLESVSFSQESPVATSTETAAVEVEDDSHLPLAIRQQRARLAAKGKPLPPISKYKKVTTSKENKNDQIVEKTLSSPQSLPTGGVASPIISFTSPAKPSISPALGSSSTPTSPNQKYLTPALLKQKERLEKKKAAAAAVNSPTSLSSYRLTTTESTSEPPSTKVTSPLISHTSLSSTLKQTSVFSPTLIKKSNAFEIKEQASSPSLQSPTKEEFGQSTRRRGLSTSQSPNVTSTPVIPTSPLASSFMRRSKEGDRPKSSHLVSIDSKDSDSVARTSQSDTHRYTSRISTSSSRSGWDDFGIDEDDEKERSLDVSEMGSNKSLSIKKDSVETTTTGFASGSSSFYKQVVPGLDDMDESGDWFGKSKTPTATSPSAPTTGLGVSFSSSSYLGNKKADDYDPYGPSKNKIKSSTEVDDRWTDNQEEILIGQTTTSPSVSLLSPTSTTSMSHRHDQRHSHSHNANSGFTGGHSVNTTTTTTFSASSGSSSGGSGFFGGGSGSLVGDISSIMSEKKNPALITSDYDNDNRKSSISSSSSKPSSGSNLQKSSSWSFGSWVSSAVAVASDAVDKAYESLDPEYSKIKRGESLSSPDGMGGGDPSSTSPYKKPGIWF